MSKRATPTLHDVSEKAGVSTATVSRTLNFPDQVTPRTRERVMAAVNALGYSPNFGARAMAARRTNTIGAIIPTMENAIFARGLQAFQEELHLHGFTMLVASTSYQPKIEDEQIRALVARGADGLLLIGHERDPSIYDFLETQGIPTLVTWAYDKAAPRASVGFNNRAAMADMATQVIDAGHRKLAFVTATASGNDRTKERLLGMHDAMQANGLSPDTLQVIETTYGHDQGAEAFTALMTREDRPTAVLCVNDVLAVGAIGRARDMGIFVPDEVSITGFDDMELAQITFPALTSVHVPHREMGRLAAHAIVQRVKDATPLQSKEIATHVVVRGSLSAPPEAAS